MSDIKYCYPNSDVLVNKLDIRDPNKLQIFERKLTMRRLLELIDKPIEGKFDFKHLQAIHAYIFQDVYDWAGKIRTVDIAKGNTFCNVRFISSQADVIFSKLKEEYYLVKKWTQSKRIYSFSSIEKWVLNLFWKSIKRRNVNSQQKSFMCAGS